MRSDCGLDALLDELAVVVSGERRESVRALGQRLATGRRRVAVGGQAERGKSTLVNVGSVFADATEPALAAHEQLDVAIIVLTADPPMSASERDLLGAIAGRAVARFVLSNRVDRRCPAELDRAVRFVTEILAQTLPDPAPVHPVSAAAACAGTSGRGTGWTTTSPPISRAAVTTTSPGPWRPTPCQPGQPPRPAASMRLVSTEGHQR